MSFPHAYSFDSCTLFAPQMVLMPAAQSSKNCRMISVRAPSSQKLQIMCTQCTTISSPQDGMRHLPLSSSLSPMYCDIIPCRCCTAFMMMCMACNLHQRLQRAHAICRPLTSTPSTCMLHQAVPCILRMVVPATTSGYFMSSTARRSDPQLQQLQGTWLQHTLPAPQPADQLVGQLSSNNPRPSVCGTGSNPTLPAQLQPVHHPAASSGTCKLPD
mmetsp:Transcript_6278/g.13801  ORF Transcript_6278/g.13801 Transcript_6278/m.13801 type:complete len:215 (-) Transcript_6278:3167-3811(-)